jgi:hypothetical protein
MLETQREIPYTDVYQEQLQEVKTKKINTHILT